MMTSSALAPGGPRLLLFLWPLSSDPLFSFSLFFFFFSFLARPSPPQSRSASVAQKPKPETSSPAPKAESKPASAPKTESKPGPPSKPDTSAAPQAASAGPSAEALEALKMVKELKEQVERLQKKMTILTSDLDEEVRRGRAVRTMVCRRVCTHVTLCLSFSESCAAQDAGRGGAPQEGSRAAIRATRRASPWLTPSF